MKKVKKDEESQQLDVSGVELEGADDDSIPVYDTCDDTGFLRELAKTFSDPSVKLQSKQLKDFQNKKSPLEGQTSRVHYAAYVFFRNKDFCKESPKVRREKRMREYGPAKEVLISSEGKAVFIALPEHSPIWTDMVSLILLEDVEEQDELPWVFFDSVWAVDL